MVNKNTVKTHWPQCEMMQSSSPFIFYGTWSICFVRHCEISGEAGQTSDVKNLNLKDKRGRNSSWNQFAEKPIKKKWCSGGTGCSVFTLKQWSCPEGKIFVALSEILLFYFSGLQDCRYKQKQCCLAQCHMNCSRKCSLLIYTMSLRALTRPRARSGSSDIARSVSFQWVFSIYC